MSTVKGRGLGLAVSYSIVHNHGGAITAESLIGKGTTIAVYLPQTARAAEPDDEDDEDDEEPPEHGSRCRRARRQEETEGIPRFAPRGRVLIMDDEPLVLEMAGAAVRRLGYAATLTRSGAEAIVQYQIGLDSGRRFDAVILDLTVPGGIGGPETLARLRQSDPGVRAALSSGYTDHPAVTDWAGSGFAAFIAKPLLPQGLRGAARHVSVARVAIDSGRRACPRRAVSKPAYFFAGAGRGLLCRRRGGRSRLRAGRPRRWRRASALSTPDWNRPSAKRYVGVPVIPLPESRAIVSSTSLAPSAHWLLDV